MIAPAQRWRWILLTALACPLAAATAPEELPRGRVIERVVCRADPTQSYALYLPAAYDPARAWPALLCFDPGGRGRVPVELFAPAAEQFGYVVAGSNNSRNGPMGDNATAVAALIADVGQRFVLDPRRLYAAGFSGGARVAIQVAAAGVVQGVVACSAAYPGGETPAQVPFVLFGTAGTDDFNNPEMLRTDEALDAQGVPHRVVFFPGRHDWPPPALAREALAWLALQAMRSGVRPRDPAFVQATFAQRRTAAAALPPPEAWREYKSLAADFAGLPDAAEAAARAQALAKTPEVRAWRKEQRRMEDAQQAEADELFADARDGRLGWLRRSAAELRQRGDAPADSPDRRVARRVLDGTAIGAIEQGQQCAADHRYGEAVQFMELAATLRPANPQTQYLLARVCALNGERAAAFAALQAAVDAGFRDAARAEGDDAFARLRSEPAWPKLLAAMRP